MGRPRTAWPAKMLEEGLDETLTVNSLPLEGWRRRTLSTTNPIEPAFSVVETVCRRVKCWRQGDHLERWGAVLAIDA